MKLWKCLFNSLLAVVVLSGCDKSDDAAEPVIDPYMTNGKAYMDAMFGTYYWWYAGMPADVQWHDDFYDYFDDHIVSRDRWSWMESGQEWRDSQSGTVSGTFGAVYAQPLDYGDYDVYVKYVLLNSPMDKAGVRRGWRLDSIGGYSVRELIRTEQGLATLNEQLGKSTNDYVFVDAGGESHALSLSAASVSTHTYLDYRVFTPSDYPGLDHKVAYFNYRSFVSELASSDISMPFGVFESEGVEDLILDLRYNGGGSTDALQTLVGYMVPKKLDGEVFLVVTHNDKLSGLDQKEYYKIDKSSLSLERVFVITGAGTASASEVLINGLRDGLGSGNVIMVGDTTYGKPNGMYAFAYPEGTEADYYADADYVFLPICFYTCNKSGEQIPDTGFIPNVTAPDDLYHDWGPEEYLTGRCLSYIATGSFRSPDRVPSARAAEGKPADGYAIPREEDAADYGRLTSMPPRR